MRLRPDPRSPRLLAVLGMLLVALGCSGAAPGLPFEMPVVAWGRTGQFLVRGASGSMPDPIRELKEVGTNRVIRLRPELLAITADRVKTAVDRRLDARGPWASRIHIQMLPTRPGAQNTPQQVAIRAEPIQGGWKFQVPVPGSMDWQALVRALVEVVLLEHANRSNRGPEVLVPPLWLSEGLTQLIFAQEGRDLVLEEATVINRNRRYPDPLAGVRTYLQGRPPLPFSDLDVLSLERIGEPAKFEEFQMSATLFTEAWVRTPVGRRFLLDFLGSLPGNLNWQTAFLKASRGTFLSLRDVEKWWAVTSAETLSTDPTQRWTPEKLLESLDRLRTETVSRRQDTNSAAEPGSVRLADLVKTWDPDAQQEVLSRKLVQWQVLAFHAPKELQPLCLEYSNVVQSYVNARFGPERHQTPRGQLEVRGPILAAVAARRLAELDRRLDAALAKGSPKS